MSLKIGEPAPDFSLQNEAGETVTLSHFHGRQVILYFYPKDDTPGCTREACDFRDAAQAIASANAVVIGISKDKPERHRRFKEKYQLPFTLLADENGDVCEAYGIINKKSLFGKTFLGIQRSTFLIDEQGIIQAIWRKVKVNGHIKQVLDECQ